MSRTIERVLAIAATSGALSAAVAETVQPHEVNAGRFGDTALLVAGHVAVGEVRLAQAGEPATSQSGTPAASNASSDIRSSGVRDRQFGDLEEIIVSAQKRVERLEEVPISISVIGGEALDQSTARTVNELLGRMPGVTGTPSLQGGSTQLTVRGVTATESLFHGANPIGYYLDSIPFGFAKSAISPDASAYDLDRVEVLRGPQGTLYGATALNGVMRLLTRNADLNETQFKARTSASATAHGGDNVRGDAALNVPLITGKLAVRAVAGYEETSGWLDKPGKPDFNDGQVGNYRLKVNAQPTDKLSLGASAWFSRSEYGGPSQGDDHRQNSFVNDEPMEANYDAYNLNVTYDFGAFSLSSATSRLDFSNPNSLDFFGLMIVTGLDSDVVTQEFSANSATDGVWRWSLGAMYRDAKDRVLQYFTAPEPGSPRERELEFLDHSESYAVYGELKRLFGDGQFELTAGARYFQDSLRSQEGTPGLPPDLKVNPEFHAVTPRVVLSWHPIERSTIYASYAEGFRSGYDQYLTGKLLLGLPPVKPDTLRNYEVGAKGLSGDGAVSYEAAVYFMDWRDVQQSLNVIVNGIPGAANMNSGSASGLGVDLGATLNIGDRVTLGASFSWNDLTYDAEVISGGVVLFAKGDRLSNSPEYTAGLSADYNFPIGSSGFAGQLSLSGNYVSEQPYVTLLEDRYSTIGDPMLIGRASLSVESAAHWTVGLFVDNLTDENGSPIIAQFGVPDWSVRIRPRTVGLQLECAF